MHKTVRFKGWSYAELADAFDLKMKDQDDVEIIQRYLWSKLGTDEQKWVAKTIRRYIKAMLKYHHIDNYAQMYDGMLCIDNDECLIKATIYLLPLMWT